jgi:ATP synthase F1 subcomplex gamma subunit 
VANLQGEVNISYAEKREVNKILVVVITSDKGLCGAFNANTLKATKLLLTEKYASQYANGRVDLLTIGKRAFDGLKNSTKGYLNRDFVNLFQNLNFEDASKAAEYIMYAFEQKVYDRVEVVYSKFKNAATQINTVEQFLPISTQNLKTSKKKADYIFEPQQEKILKDLVPNILKTQFFRYLLDSNASEHGARMTAMDKATENANELLKSLNVMYNRARQAAITTELSEIVSGAAALSNG